MFAGVRSRGAPARRAGFTLLELLAVIVLIAILIGIVLGAAQSLVKVARVKRANTTGDTLKVALCAYRHEYNTWPVPTSPPYSSPPVLTTNGNNENVLIVTNLAHNAQLFDMLRTNAAANAAHIPFLDETALLTLDASGNRMPLYRARPTAAQPLPIVFQNRDNSTDFFKVTINFESDTVAVSPCSGER
jgi:prepilin-type N-terminal cleavage/methylation domain-containing protein